MTGDKAAIIPIKDDGSKGPAQKGNTKVTRADWLNLALDILISDGVDHIKILSLSERLGVSRSSFYWYFKSREDLLSAVLKVWRETNTQALVSACEMPAETITGAICNLFRCFVDTSLFDPQLDFAVRDWSRRSGAVRRILDQADGARLAAVAQMFRRHGYDEDEAEIRARILYFTQLGYYTFEPHEPIEERLKYVPAYLFGFTGQKVRPEEMAALRDYAQAKANHC